MNNQHTEAKMNEGQDQQMGATAERAENPEDRASREARYKEREALREARAAELRAKVQAAIAEARRFAASGASGAEQSMAYSLLAIAEVAVSSILRDV